MTTLPTPAFQMSAPIPDPSKRKRVLLVDTSQAKRELRAEVMRKLGMEVDCAADIDAARSWWKAALYDLVLVNMEKGLGHRDKFCDDVRGATPPQRLAFLVGQPAYLSNAPDAAEEIPLDDLDTDHRFSDRSADVSADVAKDMASVVGAANYGNLKQRWGILEASRRISAARSAAIARTQAMRALPPPPRDTEGRPGKAVAASLDDLLREELR